MFKFALKNIRHNKKWAIVTIAGIVISAMMITAVATFAVSMLNFMQRDAVYRVGDWHAKLSNHRFENLEDVTEHDFVDEYIITRNVGYARLPTSLNHLRPYLFLMEYSDNQGESIPLSLLDGRMPENIYELVISLEIIEDAGSPFEIGDVIELEVGRRSRADAISGTNLRQNNPLVTDINGWIDEVITPAFTREFTIVGIMNRPSFEFSGAPGYTVITYLDANNIAPRDVVDIHITTHELNENFFEKAEQFRIDTNSLVQNTELNRELLQLYGIAETETTLNVVFQLAIAVIFIIMIASVSLIYNAFAISVSERTKQLGTLASIGATKRQKAKFIYFEGLIISLIAIPTGIILGTFGMGLVLRLSSGALRQMGGFYAQNIDLVIEPYSIFAAIIISVLSIAISSYFPARRASKVSPIEALRQTGDFKIKNKEPKSVGLISKLFGFEGVIAQKNIKRNSRKYRTTKLSLILSLVLFLTVSYFSASFAEHTTQQMRGINYDVEVRHNLVGGFDHNRIHELEPINEELMQISAARNSVTVSSFDNLHSVIPTSGVTEAAQQVRNVPWGEGLLLRARLITLDDVTFDQFARRAGVNPDRMRQTDGSAAIIINQGASELRGRHVQGDILNRNMSGEQIWVSFGDNIHTRVELEVVALTSHRPTGITIPEMSEVVLVVSNAVFANIQRRVPRHAQDPVLPRVLLEGRDSFELDRQAREILLENSDVTNGIVRNVYIQTRAERNTVRVISIFSTGFIILISLIAIANVFNTLNTGIALRKREFAMLRATGMTVSALGKSLRFESILLSIISLLFAVPLSIGISYAIYLFQQLENQIISAFSLPIFSYILGAIVTFVIMIFTMMLAAQKVKKESIVERLKQ